MSVIDKDMSVKESDNIYLYISSIADSKTFPENTSSNFENRILPLSLELNREYEVGLSNILFPKFFYCIRAGEPECGIGFHAQIKQSHLTDYEYNFYNYLPKKNIVSNFKHLNIISIVATINHQLMKELRGILQQSYLEYFPYSEIIYYDTILEKVVMNTVIVESNEDILYKDIHIDFASHIALVLGFDPDYRYSVFHKKDDDETSSAPPASNSSSKPPSRKVIAPHSVRPDSGNDYLYIYSDIVPPTRFGNQIVNILDAIPLPHDSTSKGVNPIMYKPLTASTIESVAIKITNQNGKPIYFENGHSVTCVLHIRPR